MRNDILRQLQATTHLFETHRFDVVVLAFGQVIEGTIVSHRPYMAMLKAQGDAITFSPKEWTHEAITDQQKKIEAAFASDMANESETTLYVAHVTIDAAVKVQLIAIPFDEVKAWSLVGAHKIDAAELAAEAIWEPKLE